MTRLFTDVALGDDRLLNKIHETQRVYAVESAVTIGKETAQIIRNEFGTRDPRAISESLNLEVRQICDENRVGPLVLIADYDCKNSTILLYEKSISRLNQLIAAKGLQETLRLRDVTEVFVAHEMFHHLEEARIGQVSKKFKVTTLKFGPIAVKSGIPLLSELAADAFARDLLDLTYPLQLFRCLLMATYGGREIAKNLKLLAGPRCFQFTPQQYCPCTTTAPAFSAQ